MTKIILSICNLPSIDLVSGFFKHNNTTNLLLFDRSYFIICVRVKMKKCVKQSILLRVNMTLKPKAFEGELFELRISCL